MKFGARFRYDGLNFQMTAWVNGFIGMIASFWVGTSVLGLGALEITRCIAASLIAGMIALLGTLKGERTPWVRKHVMNRSVKTWVIFLSLYFGIMMFLAPALQGARVLSWMVLPLILCTGFTILVFGPIQDGIVARIQRRSRAR